MTNISVKLPGLNLKNPVMPASGTFGFADVPAAKKFDLNELGALIIKTATPNPRLGNPQPQIAVLDNGVLNSVGLTNPGIDKVISEKLSNLKKQYPALPIIASVGGESEEGYIEVAQKLSDSKLVNALEINVSCPNVAQGGMAFGVHPRVVEKLTAAIKNTVDLPVFVKLTPNVTDIVALAQAAETGGADGLSLINTVTGMRINIKTRKPLLGNNFGGYSGPAVKPIALYQINQVRRVTNLPIIGMGGIASAEDVVEFMLAGANAVAVGSAHFKDPLACPHIVHDLPQVLNNLGVNDIKDLVGQVEYN
ncbi:dihydroorotate dehydrogenase [Lactobacillus kullabergensis]|uniref:dihydroorotate dehydrogenase n=1 Tax=Lactobacillus TaxID=1578 RepID=UPI0018DB5224|nr:MULTISPECIES: dihydroorotate dehydrogenase [Lactobacillus]MBI0121555.1 dihydroorotate dehydrogenase [Lactobacillus sp. M0398]MBI0122236.1 dihydroorotate dehydrogenase [Lactobacillus sp. W8174]MBI0134700.1 dihydroorotate dehydrogenase [Lactobacillus sp. W8173]MCX0290300.1 dihydroorotate dehydrogenase [Lactobacillus kullabergensis]